MKNKTKLDFRKIVMTLVLMILVTNMIFAICIPNKALAAENWDDFYDRVTNALDKSDYDSLSLEDLKRFNIGPQGKEENTVGGTSWKQDYKKTINLDNPDDKLTSLQTSLLQAYNKKNNQGSAQLGDNITHTEEENKTMKEIRDEIVDFYDKHFVTADGSGPIYDDKIDFVRELQEYNKKLDELGETINIRSDEQLSKAYEAIKNQLKEYGYTVNDFIEEENEKFNEEMTEQEEDPMEGTLGNYDPNTPHTIDEIMNEADSFINTGKEQTSIPINSDNVIFGSGLIYNILLAIAVVVAVIVGLYLAIKFMMSSAEDKAKVKEMLIPYIAGCIVIFSAFTIWKLVVTILGNIA